MKRSRWLVPLAVALWLPFGEAQAVVPVLVSPLAALGAVLGSLLLGLLGYLLGLFKPSTLKLAAKLLWRQKTVVGGLVLVAVGSGVLFRAYSAGGGGPGAEAAADGSWPMFRGDPLRTGALSGEPGPSSGRVTWAFASEARTFYASAAVVGNRVYATSAETGVFEDAGAVYCLDADTGRLLWKSRPDGYRATFSSPVVHGNYLVCGEGLHFTENARVVCLDIRKEGAILWEYRTQSHVESTPCIADGRVFVGAGDDGFYCFELAPGPDGLAKLVWHVESGRFPDAESSPVVYKNKVYFGLGNDGNAVCCLDAATGAEIWRTGTPYPVLSSPTICRGKLFVGMGTGNLIETAEVIRDREIQRLKDQGRSEDEIAEARTKLEPAGEVWRLDPASGKVEWKFRTGTTVLECVAAGKDRIFFGTREGTVFCLSFDGEELAKWNACAPIVSSPAVAGALVYVVTEAGKLYALAADSLRPVWEARIGREGPFVSSPTIARGRVYVGSSDSGFLCLGGAGETGEISVWAGHLGGPGQGGTVDGSALPPRGALAWTYPERQEGRSESAEPMALTGPVACSAGRLFVPVGSGEKAGLLCLDASAAPEAVPREIWHFRTPNGVWLSPAAAKERVFCVAGREGQEERSLYCLDAAMGNVRWKKPVESRASGRFTINGTHVVVQDKPGVLSCFSLNGDPLWARSVGGIVVDVEIADGMLLVASGSPGVLRALDIGTGAELWSREAQEVFLTAPAAGKATCYVGTAEGVAAYSLVDGARLWVSPVGPVRTPLAVGPQCLVCVNASSEFLVLDAESGAVIGRLPDALPSLPPLLAEDGALFATIPEIRLYRFADRNSLCWMRTAPFGSLKSPMILADSKVYFTTDRNGLVCAEEERER